jgi:hypothetical protein
MEYSMNAVANKMIMVLAVLSGVVAVIGYVILMTLSEDAMLLATIMGVNVQTASVSDAFPFMAGVLVALGVNIAKVILMKRAVDNAMQHEALQAKLYLQRQYFTRLILMAAALGATGWLHANAQTDGGNPQYVNFMGAFFVVLLFPIATHSMRFFLRDELKDAPQEILKPEKESGKSTVNEIMDELNAIGAENNDSDSNE